MSSSTGATEPGTKTDGSGNDAGSDRKQGRVLGFLGTLQGLIAAVAALIAAIVSAIYGGTQLAGQSNAQPTVFVTVTAGATAANRGTVTPDGAPSATNSTAASASKNVPLTSLPVVGADNNGYTVGPTSIAEVTYKNSLVASDSCADYGTVTYEVAKKYKRLHALVGVSGGSLSSGERFNFSVSIDNDDSAPGETGPAMNAGEAPQPIDVNIAGASRITLWAVTPDCGVYGDAVWINPTLSS